MKNSPQRLPGLPNLPLDEVPDGVDEHGNVQRHVFGAVRNYAFTPKPHDDLGGMRSAPWISRPPRS
jgi:seryl-tRNA synthetase